MDINTLTKQLATYVPEQFEDVCDAVSILGDELEQAKKELSNKMMIAQQQDDFDTARGILSTQEQLVSVIKQVQQFLDQYVPDNKNRKEAVKILKEKSKDTKVSRIDQDKYPYNNVPQDFETMEVTHKHPEAFIFQNVMYVSNTWKALLIRMCEILYMKDHDPFVKKARVNSKRRISFDKITLRMPEQIMESGIWIETNLSASAIRESILALLDLYRIPHSDLKVILRED